MLVVLGGNEVDVLGNADLHMCSYLVAFGGRGGGFRRSFAWCCSAL